MGRYGTGNTTSAWLPGPSHGSWTRGPCKENGAGRPQDHPEETPGHTPGGRIFTATRGRTGIGRGSPRKAVHGIGVPARCRGEALLWQPSGHPVGTNATNGRRGGLVGPSPEALCGEAPKGQPVIRRESLVVVCVEAPQGQPMIHRPHPRQVVRRPMREEPGRRVKRRAPRSSPWTRAGKKESGDPSPEPLHGKQAATLRR